MYLIGFLLMLLSLSTIWQNSSECYGQKMPKSIKKADQEPKGTELSDKMSIHFDILIENFNKKIFATERKEGQTMKKIMTELSKKQRMLEAIYGKRTEEESENYAKDDEYKCLKKRSNEIYQNDPPLSQLLEHLITVQMYAKEGLEYDNANELNARIETLKGTLAYAATFMAKRHKIWLNSERRGEEKVEKRTNDQKLLWTELANYYEEFEMDKIGKKCHKNSEYYGNKNGKEKENKGKEERFFRFVARTLETKWEGNAFSNGQNDDDDEDDALHRRRRKKRRNSPGMMNSAPTDGLSNNQMMGIAFLAVFLFMGFMLCMRYFCCDGICATAIRSAVSNTAANRSAVSNMRANRSAISNVTANRSAVALAAVVQRPGSAIGRDSELLSLSAAYNAIKLVSFAQHQQENSNCAICLSSIEPQMMIRPLPCKHFFHDECIKGWLNGHTTCPVCRRIFEVSAGKIEIKNQNTNIGSSNGK